MDILVDTNLLIRSVRPADPFHRTATQAIATLTAAGDTVCVVPQAIYEFWAVATRPVANNGLGLQAAGAAAEIAGFRRQYRVLDDTPSILTEWERLVTTHAVLGKNAHDARLVAAMLAHGLTHLLTFNAGDFKRFPGITVLTPAAVAPPGP